MATSSRPFQSRTVARLVTGYRQMAHGAGHWLRQGRTAAVWGLQVAVYPLYVAVQGLRMGYRQLRAAHPWQPLWAKVNGSHIPELVEADTPIRALLSIIQPPVVQAPKRQPMGLSLVNRSGRWLRQSRAGAVLTPGQWHLLPLRASIRGVASDLATRQVVLVTVDNDIFADLTRDQQQRLQQAMVLMLAEYRRLRRCHTLDHQLQQPRLPLPKPKPAALPPLRWLPLALRWLQTSPLAAATNLFGEAQQQTRAISEPTIAPSWASNDTQIAHYPVPATHPTGPTAKFDPSRSFRDAPGSGYRSLQFNGRPTIKSLSANPLEAEPVGLTVASPRAVVEYLSSPVNIAEVREVETALGPTASAQHSTALGSYPTDQRQLVSSSAIEAQVTQSSYVDAPLVAVLRGLDWVLYAIETWLRGFWSWLQKQW